MKNVGEYMSDMFGTLIKPLFNFCNHFILLVSVVMKACLNLLLILFIIMHFNVCIDA